MSRISDLFARKNKDVLNVYCTAGFPEVTSTVEVMEALVAAGVDLIELGIPYSDPLADGTVIQASSAKALNNGMNIPLLFEQLKDIRNT
ncbi:MAG: tryptophan synthase subunit alpha, partial [Flavisolibacter sp.]|nr:tryptophan synthase subunit alpha [Flavisolibacter sp.]